MLIYQASQIHIQEHGCHPLVLLAPILFGEPDPVSDICYPFLMEVMSRLCVLGSTLNQAAHQWS